MEALANFLNKFRPSEQAVERLRQLEPDENELRKNCFGLIRLVLALMVLVHHNNAFKIPSLGLTAVQGFFVLSGFMVSASFFRKSDVKDYLEARCRRIFPGLWTVVILSAVLGVFITQLTPIEYFKSSGFFRYLFFNGLMLDLLQKGLPGITSIYGDMINGPVYTLKIEFGCYLLLPLLFHFGRKFRLEQIAAVGYVASCIWVLACLTAGVFFKNPIFAKLSWQAPGMLTFFLAGTLCYLYFYKLKPHLTKLMVIGAVLTVGALVADFPFLDPLVLPWGLSFLLIGIGYKFPQLQKICGKTDLSYGVYLYHYPLGVFLTNLVPALQTDPLSRLAAVTVLSLIFAWLSWNLVESKAMKRAPRVAAR